MKKPKNIHNDSQILIGVGSNAWFHIEKYNNKYRIERYNEIGELDCSKIFQCNQQDFNINDKYQFTYISHCMECRIIQNDKTFTFKAI